jgi:hypothetical protein
VNFETEPTLQPGMEESAIDTATDASHTITEVSAGLQAAVNRLTEAIAAARLPERPLSIIRTITGSAARELFVAFLFGISVAQRRQVVGHLTAWARTKLACQSVLSIE